MNKTIDFNDVRSLSILLTRNASITDTSGEKAFPSFLQEIISQIPYFRDHPEDIQLHDIPGDPKERSNLTALVRGKGPDCLVLTGHYDVVQTSMYGSLEPWAFDPESLSAKILEQLADVSNKENPLYLLKEDIQSGEFIPGRGILDMKSGLAAGLSVLSRFAAPYERVGNILFLAVADEEGKSHGMKAARTMLPEFLQHRGLNPVAIFNLDSAVDKENGEAGRAVFTGSVGKTLPFVYFIGHCTHAGAPFDGINAVLTASEFAREIECNPDAMQERQVAPGEEAPPPTILYFRECRTQYDVTTPSAVFCAINLLSHQRNPDDIMEHIRRITQASINKAISLLRERASTLSRRTSEHFKLPATQPTVIEFCEFSQRAERTSPGIVQTIRNLAAREHPGDQVLQSIFILNHLLPYTAVEGPAAVIGFAPPYYARAELDSERFKNFVSLLRETLSTYSLETGISVRVRPYFPGISDMSFLAPADSKEERSYLASQSPVIDSILTEDSEAHISCPVINIGPWGRDYHQMGERVHATYAFKQLPDIIWRLAQGLLS